MSAQGALYLNSFVPGNWMNGGVIPEARLNLLKGAGWEPFEYGDKRYLMPDPEMAQFVLGAAYEDYRAIVEGRGGSVAAPSPYAGAYGDLIDAILYNESLDGRTKFESGATLLYPKAFGTISPDAGILRRVGLALKGGWAMVNPITEGRDMFLLPPEAIIKGREVTPEDNRISRGVLQKLHELGLVGLRGRGFGNARIAPTVFAMPPRSAQGRTWESLVADQTERWGGAYIKPVVDFVNYPFLDDLPELGRYLTKHHPYVERFDLIRIEFYLSAWRRTADFDALESMMGLIKGVMGEIAARREIVDEYRSHGCHSDRSGLSRGVEESLAVDVVQRKGSLDFARDDKTQHSHNSILLFAPQIMSGKDVLERSDAMVVRIEDGGAHAAIERVWEVVTAEDERAIAHAQEQHRASLSAYQKGGIVFRDADGRSLTFDRVVLPQGDIEGYAKVISGTDAEIDDVLEALRDRMVAMMEKDLIGTRVQNKFMPTVEGLKEILREPKGVERLMEILNIVSPTSGSFYISGRVENDGKVSGLRIVDEKDAERAGAQKFLLGFDIEDGKCVLRIAKHKGALDLAVSWVESRFGRELDAVEKRFLAGVLGTQMRAYDAEDRITVEVLTGHFREHGIERFLDLMRVVGVSIPGGRIYVTGRVFNNREVVGIRIMDEKKAENFGDEHFRLGFDPVDGKFALREAKRRNALELAVPLVESRLGRSIDFMEKSFLARVLGTKIQPDSAEEFIKVDEFAWYLSKHGIERLIELLRMVGATVPKGRIYVTGCVGEGRQLTGLRMVDEDEVGAIGDNRFLLGFDLVEGGYTLREAKHSGALDLALPWVESRFRRGIDAVEKTFLARVLGTKIKPHGAEEPITVDELAVYLSKYGIKRLIELMRVVRATVPEGRIYAVALVARGRQVTGLRIVDEKEAGNLEEYYFLLPFDFKDGKYHLDLANVRAHSSLKKPLL